ncbi:uncharacterized protein K452DRAFT_337188 [Aplosporella prunicola CBS 121167]|uniref:Uncharacterized protein n=1 Tax=Aplosporella prunicola CBS 121167 TaxID=1176127 RepID=A0A6A6BSA4_9PEZI|nr:uncharacterized protein K452DRAFT_337188 [Aplosporella prunicola CBS 121167]KAF2146880.1 hypothetical protein K452DRAFT_337188 [Aplosporella prunicola CBS 121167]
MFLLLTFVQRTLRTSATLDSELWQPRKTPQEDRSETDSTHKERRYVVEAHRRLLAIFYHKHPDFPFGKPEKMVQEIRTLVGIADHYGSTQIINVYMGRLRLDAAALDVFAQDPINLMKMSLTMKSDWMFREATIYLVSLPEAYWKEVVLHIDQPWVARYLEKKRIEFKNMLQDIDMKLLRFTIDPKPDSAVFERLAEAYFRSIVAKHLNAHAGSECGKNYAAIYRNIQSQKFVEVNPFHKYCKDFGMPKWMMDNAHTSLRQLHQKAAAIIEPILVDRTAAKRGSREPENMKLPLAFIEVADQDILWNVKSEGDTS